MKKTILFPFLGSYLNIEIEQLNDTDHVKAIEKKCLFFTLFKCYLDNLAGSDLLIRGFSINWFSHMVIKALQRFHTKCLETDKFSI